MLANYYKIIPINCIYKTNKYMLGTRLEITIERDI